MFATFFTDTPLLIAYAAVLPASLAFFWWLIRREFNRQVRKERFLSKQCVACGYDLRDSHGRCPECGTPIAPTDLPMTAWLDIALMADQFPTEKIAPRMPGPTEFQLIAYESDNIYAVKFLADHLNARGIHAEFSDANATLTDVIRNEIALGFQVTIWSKDLEKTVEVVRGFSRFDVPATQEK